MPSKLTGTARTTLTRVWLCNSVGCADGSADKKWVVYTRNYLKINAVQTSVQTVQTNVQVVQIKVQVVQIKVQTV